MKLGLFGSLGAAYFRGTGPLRVAYPALAAAGTALFAWPFSGDQLAILRQAGPEIFPVASAGYLITSAVVAVRTGAGKAARGGLYGDRELLSAGLPPLRQCAERLLFSLCFSLLLLLYALAPLMTAGIVSGIASSSLPRMTLLLLGWPLAAMSAGDLFRSLLPRRALLQTSIPLSFMALSLIYRAEGGRSISPLLSLQNLSGARFFTGNATSPDSIILVLALSVCFCYTGLWFRLKSMERRGAKQR